MTKKQKKTLEEVVEQWVSDNNTKYKGKRNALRRCGTTEQLHDCGGSNRISRLHNLIHRDTDVTLSYSQSLCLGWAFSHVRSIHIDRDEEGTIKKYPQSFGAFMAKKGIHVNSMEQMLSTKYRDRFVRHLNPVLRRLHKESIPASLAKDIVYFGDSMKFRWRTDYDLVEIGG